MTDSVVSMVDSEAQMMAVGADIANLVKPGSIIFLEGDLGVGKTTLCRGILTALGHVGAVKSPTYTLVEPYRLPTMNAFHFDLYRLGDPEELEFIGIRDYFDGQGLVLVEWPERGAGTLPPADLIINISVQGMGRSVVFSAGSTVGRGYIDAIGAANNQRCT